MLTIRLVGPQDLNVDFNHTPDTILYNLRTLQRTDYRDYRPGCLPGEVCAEYLHVKVNERLCQTYDDQCLRLQRGLCLGCVRDSGVNVEEGASMGHCSIPKHNEDSSCKEIEENFHDEAK